MKKRFEGYCNTPFLWSGVLEGLSMFSSEVVSINDSPQVNSVTPLRLGKLIEQFVLFELQCDQSIELLNSNVQVFRNKVTIGELDCLIKRKEDNIHLEIIYKFYLYDPNITGELNRWLGPNRNDSLVLKLSKLKDKQLPLLYERETKEVLSDLQIDIDSIKQHVCFKAQLFVPFDLKETTLPLINNDCVIGFYIRFKDLNHFQNQHFFIPSKLDWLVEPHSDVLWISVVDFKVAISELLAKHKSPLCWMKTEDGRLQKFFVVWWD